MKIVIMCIPFAITAVNCQSNFWYVCIFPVMKIVPIAALLWLMGSKERPTSFASDK